MGCILSCQNHEVISLVPLYITRDGKLVKDCCEGATKVDPKTVFTVKASKYGCLSLSEIKLTLKQDSGNPLILDVDLSVSSLHFSPLINNNLKS